MVSLNIDRSENLISLIELRDNALDMFISL